jgi:hypothetical protein
MGCRNAERSLSESSGGLPPDNRVPSVRDSLNIAPKPKRSAPSIEVNIYQQHRQLTRRQQKSSFGHHHLERAGHHELWHTKSRYFSRSHAMSVNPFLSSCLQLAVFLVARKIPFDDPEVLNYVRIAYVTAQVTVLGIYYYISYTVRSMSCCTPLTATDISSQIKRKNDQTVLKYGAHDSFYRNPLGH